MTRKLTIYIIVLVLGVAIIGLIGAASFRSNPRVTPSPTASATASPVPSVTASAVPTVSSIPTAAAWSTADYSYAFTGTVPPLPQLVALRVGAHPEGGYDRIAFDFQQAAAPGYTIKYVNQVVRDGSGQTVALAGGAYLQIVFNPAAAHNDAGQSTLPSPPTNPVNTGFAGLKSYVLNGDFEGHISVALGQAARSGFKVTQVHQPSGLWTVVVDVPRP